MKVVKFNECNFTFQAGDNPNTGDLSVALAKNAKLAEGRPFIISRFELSDEELARIVKEKALYISIMGADMPPIMPFVEDPFEEMGFELMATEFPSNIEMLRYREIEYQNGKKKEKATVLAPSDAGAVPGSLFFNRA